MGFAMSMITCCKSCSVLFEWEKRPDRRAPDCPKCGLSVDEPNAAKLGLPKGPSILLPPLDSAYAKRMTGAVGLMIVGAIILFGSLALTVWPGMVLGLGVAGLGGVYFRIVHQRENKRAKDALDAADAASTRERATLLAQVLSENPTSDLLLEAIKSKASDEAFMELIRTANNDICTEALKKWNDWRDLEAMANLKDEATKYRAHVAHASQRIRTKSSPSTLQVTGLGGMDFLDLRTPQEKQVIEDAAAGKSIGPTFDALLAELVAIGQQGGFTVASDSPERGVVAYDEERRHKGARKIGMIFHQAGGMEILWAAFYRIKATGRNVRDLERCWNGVGEWRS